MLVIQYKKQVMSRNKQACFFYEIPTEIEEFSLMNSYFSRFSKEVEKAEKLINTTCMLSHSLISDCKVP